MLKTFSKAGYDIWACARKRNEEFELKIDNIAKETGVLITPVAFTQSFAAEVFRYGITVNAIAPGLINTDMSSIFEGNDPEEPIRHTALERKIEPSEIANVVMGLLEENMNIINGTVITIHGGHK